MAPPPSRASTIPLSITSSATGSGQGPSSSHSLRVPQWPPSIQRLVHLRQQADAALNSPALRAELAQGHAGPNSQQASDALAALVDAAAALDAQANHQQRKYTRDEHACAHYCHAFALARIGEFDGTRPSALPSRLDDALSHFERAADLLSLPPPPALDSVPSVTRPNDPNRQTAAVDLAPVPAWAAQMLAEWARTQATRAFASCVGQQGQVVVREDELADLLDLACRRNVQALFTPVDPLSPEGDNSSSSTASTVMGNAHLIRDLSSLLPFSSSSSSTTSTSSPQQTWSRRLNWATHVSDVRFVLASLSATQLVDAAQSAAQVLQARDTTPRQRAGVKRVVERTLRRIAPFERTQGNALLALGRVMLDAVGAVYLGREVGFQEERRRREAGAAGGVGGAGEDEDEDEDEFGSKVQVPENDLVVETRRVLIRAAALFENAYASVLRSPRTPSRRKLELRLLRRLEATYCDLELLDNDATPEVQQLRHQRIERAVFINDALVALEGGSGGARGAGGRDGEEDEMEESDQERAEEEDGDAQESDDSDDDDDDEGEEERLARRFARAARLA
ncbi:Proteophosphoglycan ppg4 [Rhodotorula diobovata]|uniref:Proteophosphoglycan ppg4 n=1 Tax=Rhodotorula diobovata TaxID=5288 RepID=A0A5C5G8U8_9BASI|nr:Proteophosphoglycan ppg4 [Rhodotorula diobovata]